jgi:2-keto-3-deoxy-L-rhamnonate aldolase RhmA
MTTGALKQMAATRSLKIGHLLFEFMTPNIGYFMKSAGCAFAIVDMEHNGLGFESLATVARYLHAAGVPVIARVATRDYSSVSRACDVGVDGIMVPMISTLEEAKGVIAAMKYFPEGRRGVALPPLQRYAPQSMPEAMKSANRDLALFLQIENAEGVENAAALAALDGVDCLWIGHADLSWSLGVPGQLDSEIYRRGERQVIQAARGQNKSLGRLVPDVESGLAAHRLGFDFLAYSNDLKVWEVGLAAGVKGLTEGVRPGRS